MPPLADIGVEPLIIILVIVLVMLGGKKIPELLRGVGLGVGELQNGFGQVSRSARDDIWRNAPQKNKKRKKRKDEDDDSEDNDRFDGGCPPPPSAVRIWTHDESSDSSGNAGEPAASQYVGSSQER